MIIIGAGGHAREILDILIKNKFNDAIYFFDNKNDLKMLYGKYMVLKTFDQVTEVFKNDRSFCIGVGNPVYRQLLSNQFQMLGGILTSVIDKSVSVGQRNLIGAGVNIMTSAVVTNSTKISIGVLLNTLSSVHHDAEIGLYTEICPGARVLGGAKIGNYCQIGSNATILPNVKVGNNVTVGAGTVVNRDVPDNCTVVGAPAKIIKYKTASILN